MNPVSVCIRTSAEDDVSQRLSKGGCKDVCILQIYLRKNRNKRIVNHRDNVINCLPCDRGDAPIAHLRAGWGVHLWTGVTQNTPTSSTLLQHQLLDTASWHKGFSTKTQVFLLLQTIKQLTLDKQKWAWKSVVSVQLWTKSNLTSQNIYLNHLFSFKSNFPCVHIKAKNELVCCWTALGLQQKYDRCML